MTLLPEAFIGQSHSLFASEAECSAFLTAVSSSQPPSSVRLNPWKGTGLFAGARCVPWCPDGRYLPSRPSYTMDPLFWGGAYYPQEASSMVIGEIVRHFAPLRVLDLCAAPGGKTTHISSVISDDAVLVANEVIPSRSRTLCENVQRWGGGNVIVTSVQPRSFAALSGYFDLILADVPCSGEGMFRKDPDSVSEWSPESVSMCATRSRGILSDVWNALAPGGHMVFSTCTYNRSEDEEMVGYIASALGAEYIPMDGIVPPQTVTEGAGYHFYPHRTEGEGFFVAVLEKTSDSIEQEPKGAAPLKRPSKADVKILESSVSSPMEFRMVGDTCFGFPPALASQIETVRSAVPVAYSGVSMGRIIAGRLKPSHSLALYRNMTAPSVSDLTLEDALHYLRRDSQSPELFVPGISAVRCGGVAIGWANRVQGRVNNLYPSGQRILQMPKINMRYE